jgi:CheY-like chemotaxis protein/tRNA A-37 threonylcarbamoyl transferase component Bud32
MDEAQNGGHTIFMIIDDAKVKDVIRVTILGTDGDLGLTIDKTLAQRNVLCTQADQPAQIVEQVLENPPDALIVDMKLPARSGLEFYSRIKGELGLDAPPCLFLSDQNDEESVISAYEVGAADCLCKPFSMGELMAKLRLHVPKLRRSRSSGRIGRDKKVGRFTITEVILRGSMGVLYKVRHPRYPGPLALKTLETHKCDLDTLLRFRREIDLLTQLEHPHLAKFCEAGRTQKLFYFVMQFIEGTALDVELENVGALHWRRVAKLLRDLASAVNHLHRHGILHRDIKPANILLSEEQGAVLVDFGLAKHVRDQQLTGSHTMIGTPLYIAPESLEKDQTDERSDLFSVGMVGLQMLLGKAPIEETNLYEIYNRLVLSEFCHARDVPNVLPEFARIIDRLLEIDPKDRYQDAKELIKDLEKVLMADVPENFHHEPEKIA